MAKRFLYVCLGLLALAVAYHLGAASAHSQLQGQAVSITGGGYHDSNIYALTSEGDVYGRGQGPSDWHYYGNIFRTAATQSTSLGNIKARFGE